MAITIEQIQAIKDQAQQKRTTLERCKGNLEQLLKQLKDEFGCETVEEAKQKLKQMEQDGIALSQKIEKMKTRVVALWNQTNGQ